MEDYVLEQPHHWLASQKDYNIKQGSGWWIYNYRWDSQLTE